MHQKDADVRESRGFRETKVPGASGFLSTEGSITVSEWERNKRVTYKEARVYLDEVSKYGSVLGLDTVLELLDELGNPQDALKFIHIAGTNGKGSVLAFTSTILSEAGYRIGRYISPTVISYLERIQVDGTWVSEREFAGYVEEVQKAVARMETRGMLCPTVFEMETAIAFLHFRKKKCDFVVLETGLGGNLDATNIVKNTVFAVFTSISRDHMGFLGETLEEITENKSGIIKPGCIVVSAAQEPEAEHILRKRAESLGCPIVFASPEESVIHEETYKGMTFTYPRWGNMPVNIRMAGRYQLLNAAVVLELVKLLEIPRGAVLDGFEKARWTGRFTCICEEPLFIIDGAHNRDAAARLTESVRQYFSGKHIIFIMGVFRDKEYEEIARQTAPLAESIYTVELPDKDRTLKAEKLKDACAFYCTGEVRAAAGIKDAVYASWQEACEKKECVILAFGSLSYLGEVMQEVKRIENMRAITKSGDE